MAPHLHLVTSIGGVVNGNGTNGKKKRRRLIIWGSIVAVVALLIAGGVFAATRGGTKIDPSKLAKVEKGDLAKSVVATGKVTPITKVEVKSKASGIVKKLLVDYGDRVKKGQLLAQLDKIEIEAQVEQSKAGLEAAQANLQSSQADFERAKVDAEGPDVPLLKRAYDRAVNMAKDGVVSTSALEDAQKNYELALNKQNVSQGSSDRPQSEDRAIAGKCRSGPGESEAARRTAELYRHHLADRRHRALARRADGRRSQFHPCVGIVGYPRHDAGRYQRSLR